MRKPTGAIAAVILATSLAPAAAAGPFENGLGYYQMGDYASALRIWRAMANEGYAPAENNLGMMYALGQDLPLDLAMARMWYSRAADQGYAVAQFNLAETYAAFQGGAPRDYAKAADWFRKAAGQGYAPAQERLGSLYAEGQGMEQDPVKALMWFDVALARFDRSDYAGRAEAAKNRDALAAKLSPAQIAEAERLAHDWTPQITARP